VFTDRIVQIQQTSFMQLGDRGRSEQFGNGADPIQRVGVGSLLLSFIGKTKIPGPNQPALVNQGQAQT
jgi:hypothetical protein